MKQAIKKGQGIKKSSLALFKEKNGFTAVEPKVTSVSNANKQQGWILMPKAFVEATKINIPTGTVISVLGHSNVGKSTLINHAISSAQRQGIIPVIIDTENSFSFNYAINMGFKAEPIYGDIEVEEVDPETGEIKTHIENQIVNWEGDFIYYNNRVLCERFGDIDYSKGVRTKKKRKVAVIEDVATCINELLDAQDNNEIDQDLLFVWDSVGSIGCYKEYNSNTNSDGPQIKIGNPMWTAAAISAAFNSIVNDRIPGSKKISSKYTNTFIYVNKVWMDSLTNPVGPAIMSPKGGKSLRYSTRLEIVLGGQLTSGIKILKATSGGVDYNYGIETKIRIMKNHLDAPHNICYTGNMIATDLGFIAPEDLDDYKKEHIKDILKQLNEQIKDGEMISEKDITFAEEESVDTE